MKIEEVATILEAEIMSGGLEAFSEEADYAFAADFLSDVLAFGRPGHILITGLTGGQLVRTAEISGIVAVVFIRGKKPTNEMVELATRSSLALLSTRLTMYETCGRLYEAGISPADCTSVRGS